MKWIVSWIQNFDMSKKTKEFNGYYSRENAEKFGKKLDRKKVSNVRVTVFHPPKTVHINAKISEEAFEALKKYRNGNISAAINVVIDKFFKLEIYH